MNKANPRKEFFRADLASVREIVETDEGKQQYKVRAVRHFEPDNSEYRQSIEMTDEDQEVIERTFGAVGDEEDASAADNP